MRKSIWDRESRLRLESLLKQGYSLQKIAEMFDLARPTIRAEVVRGITEEEKNERRWVMYRASRAMMSEIIEDVGEDNMRDALDELRREWSEHDRSNSSECVVEPVGDADADGRTVPVHR